MSSNNTNPRKTFAIISHPDAGKTTLTEKLLLFGGAIQQAGAVKARGENRRARSDWMKVEQERGISVASSVMTFDYKDITFNLLDTPGHEDFSEDTYRVLTAVDSAVMVIDSAKGIETQTKKLFEVCRLRNVPIITFINKLDREGMDPFSLLDDIEKTLALDVTPASWPIGMGKDFLGCYDLIGDQLILMNKNGDKSQKNATIETCRGLDDEKLDRLLPAHAVAKLREDIEMVRELCPAFDKELYLAGALTPVFFGSAINNFGVTFAKGEYLLFLNNDTELIAENFIEEMLGLCQREDVGAVGARLLYQDDTIQHAGVVIGFGGIAGHTFIGLHEAENSYFHRAMCAQDYSAVTAACMMIKKSVFEAVGGFTEELAVAFNDIDYCMKVREQGKLVVYAPYAVLHHYESKSRGLEDTPEKVARFNREVAVFARRWPEILKNGDPYYNPNLTLRKSDFSLRDLKNFKKPLRMGKAVLFCKLRNFRYISFYFLICHFLLSS